MTDQFREYDTFDLALALYHWLQHNWQGQSDPLYEAFCQLTAPGMFYPSRVNSCYKALDKEGNEGAELVYHMLTEDNYRKALGIVLNYESEE